MLILLRILIKVFTIFTAFIKVYNVFWIPIPKEVIYWLSTTAIAYKQYQFISSSCDSLRINIQMKFLQSPFVS